jgi:hypothetical protein
MYRIALGRFQCVEAMPAGLWKRGRVFGITATQARQVSAG